MPPIGTSNDAVNALNSIQNTPPNTTLSALVADATGMYKLMTTFAAQTLPDTPSTQSLPEHRNGVDPYFEVLSPSGITTDTQTLAYTDLAGTQWNIQTYEGFFLQSGTLTSGTTTNSISPTLTITDPQGVTWAVDCIEQTFLLTKTQPADTDTVCAADPISGVSFVANVDTCSSYVAFSFQLQDGTVVSLG